MSKLLNSVFCLVGLGLLALPAMAQDDDAALKEIIEAVRVGWVEADGAPFRQHFLDFEGARYFEGGGQFEYLNDPEKTANSHHVNGWSTLGDIGYLDDEGYLYLTDRKSFMIISGGVNIYPQEAENVLITHPLVADVAVFGVPNDEFGEEVKAVVQPMNMDDAGPELAAELIAYARSQIAHLKCPKSVDFLEALPRHPTGKLYKRLLKDTYWQQTS